MLARGVSRSAFPYQRSSAHATLLHQFRNSKRKNRNQQQPPLLRLPVPSSRKTASHSLIPPPHPPEVVFPLFLLRLPVPPSSTVVPILLILPPSSQPPLSPYCIPLIGSSGSISPSSIFVNIMLAKRAKISSTPSPVNALTSTETGMDWRDAQRDASSGVTSRPSVATVAVCWEPRL